MIETVPGVDGGHEIDDGESTESLENIACRKHEPNPKIDEARTDKNSDI